MVEAKAVEESVARLIRGVVNFMLLMRRVCSDEFG